MVPIERQIDDYKVRFDGKRLPKPRCCRICLGTGGLRWHGSYLRGLITMTAVYSLPVRRLFCALCGHTFGLLPAFVLKFHHYARESIRNALHMLRTETCETVAGMFTAQAERCIAILTLRLWRRRLSLDGL